MATWYKVEVYPAPVDHEFEGIPNFHYIKSNSAPQAASSIARIWNYHYSQIGIVWDVTDPALIANLEGSLIDTPRVSTVLKGEE